MSRVRLSDRFSAFAWPTLGDVSGRIVSEEESRRQKSLNLPADYTTHVTILAAAAEQVWSSMDTTTHVKRRELPERNGTD